MNPKILKLEELDSLISSKQKENKMLISGLWRSAILNYESNKKVIAAARKLRRMIKSKEYSNYLKNKIKKLQ